MSTEENLPNYAELFASRFTADDQEYQEYLKQSADPPPIVEDWKSRAGGNQRNRDNRFQDYRSRRGRGDGRNWSRDNSYNQQWQGRGWGNSRQSYGQQRSYNSQPYGYQSSNSYDQRRNHDYY